MSAEDNPAAQPAEIGEALVAALGFEPTEGTKLGRKAGSSTSIADELSEAENPTVEDANDAPPVDDAFSVVSSDASADETSDAAATNGNSGSGSSASTKSGSAKKSNATRQRSRSEKSRSRNRSSSRTRASSSATTATETKPSIDEIKTLAKPTVSEAEVAAEEAVIEAADTIDIAGDDVIDVNAAVDTAAGSAIDRDVAEGDSADDTAADDTAGDDTDDPVAKAKAETEVIRQRLTEAKRKAGIVEEDADKKAKSGNGSSDAKEASAKKADAKAEDKNKADKSAATTAAEDKGLTAKDTSEDGAANAGSAGGDLAKTSSATKDTAKTDTAEDETAASGAAPKAGAKKTDAKKADADRGSTSGNRATSGRSATKRSAATTIVESKGGNEKGAATKPGTDSKPTSKDGDGAETKSKGSASTAKARASGSAEKPTDDASSKSTKSGSAKSESAKSGPKTGSGQSADSGPAANSPADVTAKIEIQPPPPSAADAIKAGGVGLSAAAAAAAAPTVDAEIPTSPPSMDSASPKADSVAEARVAPETLDRETAFPAVAPFDTPQVKPSVGRELTRPTLPDLPFRNPFRRKRRVQARKVRRVVRHIDPWSVLTFSVLFHLCVFAALLLASVLVWNAAEAAGTIENIETFITDLGDYERFVIEGEVVFRAAVAIAGILTLASSVMLVLLTVVFNLISDLVGGIRLTVIEEETVRVRRRKTRS